LQDYYDDIIIYTVIEYVDVRDSIHEHYVDQINWDIEIVQIESNEDARIASKHEGKGLQLLAAFGFLLFIISVDDREEGELHNYDEEKDAKFVIEYLESRFLEVQKYN
jgi:hypothetical protein